MGYYKKSPSFGLPVRLRYVFPFFSINFKKLFTFFFNCDIFNRAWGYSSVGRALASHVRGQGFDSPYLHHSALPLVSGRALLFALFANNNSPPETAAGS